MLYLDKADFIISKPPGENVQNKLILKNKITNSFSLIMFSGNDCDYCKELKPIFQKLVGTISNCQIGTVNISLQPDLAKLSQQTTTPIRYVPLVLFYINGTPFKEFGGNYTEANLRQFVNEVSLKAFEIMGLQKNGQPEDGEISKHSVGKAISKKVCYLNFDNAYNATPRPSD
jgi:thioredoxin-like negative regulator of GroEL